MREGKTMNEFVAIIGETKYATVQAAVDAAKSKDTVKMIANSKENVVIPEGKELVFDLNGFILSGGAESEEAHKGKAAIFNNGTIVIRDSSKDKTGKIMKDDVNTHPSYYVLNNQNTMTIESGYIFNDSGHVDQNIKGGASLICNGDESGKDNGYAKLYIKGGTLEQNNFIVLKNGESGYAEITGGKIISANESAVQNWSELKASGGEINGLVWTMAYEPAGPAKTELSKDIVVNGKIWSRKYSENGTHPAETYINGGTYNLQNVDGGKPGKGLEVTNGGSIVIKNGSFNVDPSEFLAPDASITRTPDGKFITDSKGFTIALKPKYPTRNAIEKVLFDEDEFIEILINEKTLRKIPTLLNTCAVAIVYNNKYYPVDIYNYEEQFILAEEGKELTIKEDPFFGLKKLSYFIKNALDNESLKVMENPSIYNGMAYGTCKKVNDYKLLNIDKINSNGYWMAFNFDLVAAEKEGYSELKFLSTNKAIENGTNYINIDNNDISIIGKVTVADKSSNVHFTMDNHLKLVDYSKLDFDFRVGKSSHC